MGLFGLFGPSKSEIMHQRVNDVEVFYERMVKCFKDNISIIDKPKDIENPKNKINNQSNLFWDLFGENINIQSKDPWRRVIYVKDLFELYPKSLLDDKEYVSMEMKISSLRLNFLRYGFPQGMLCEPPDKAKQRIYLKVKNNTIADIQRITTDFFQILDDNINIIGKKKDKYPQLHMRLVAMYYRTRGAVAWFNYLDKTSM